MHETDLSEELAAFLRDRASLKAQYGPKWVVYKGEKFFGAFEDFEAAAIFAYGQFRDEASLIQKITAEDEQVPLVFANAG